MRRTRFAAVALIAAVSAAGATACGSKPATTASTPSTLAGGAVVTTAAGARVGVPTTPPPTTVPTIKALPGCVEFSRFGLALNAFAYIPNDATKATKLADFTKVLDLVTADFKKAKPEFNADIDIQVAMGKKLGATGTLDGADLEANKKANEATTRWFNTTCV